MDRLQALGINTLDLYVPWNWHELADGDFDFNGRTSPRRDLHDVLRLARAHGFAILLRPGPVIRNEWRNGGYPAWLLSRPEYGMPLHDLLEGRYPPTATLQNAHSDDAAAEWMRNAAHVRYARRWLERVLHECAPYADRILAVALDDDQGAYIDNQTWPAPHLRAYLEWLRGVVQGVTGPREPVFINTYQMKVPASSPVWAMGNWYQSDAYAIGEHDRAQLEFSAALLQTRPHQPLFASEFQAGWLQGPDDARPRPADPSNTLLAMATLIGLGARGIVNFPAQDTLYPGGWEAPFANALYAWDAALTLDGTPSARYRPTAAVGAVVRAYGPQLARAHVRFDAAIAYLGGSVPPSLATNALFADVAARTIEAQQTCRAANLACALVDPRALGARALARYPLLIVPSLPAGAPAVVAAVDRTLQAYARAGGRILAGAPDAAALRGALARTGRRPVVDGVPGGATYARDPAGGSGFLTVANYGGVDLDVRGATIEADGRHIALQPFRVPARDALIARVSAGGTLFAVPPLSPNSGAPRPASVVRLRDDALLPTGAFRSVPDDRTHAYAYATDVYGEGTPAVVLDNGIVRLVVSPAAGARAFAFGSDAVPRNVFTTVGGMRDDVAVEPAPSTADRIAKYTHQFPAGTFNRPYATRILSNGARASARFTYDAPDVVPDGALFERTVTLEPAAGAFEVDERFEPHASTDARTLAAQRAVSVTSLAAGDGASEPAESLLAPDPQPFAPGTTVRIAAGHAVGLFDAKRSELATVAWRADDIDDATVIEQRFSIVVRLTLARGRDAHLRFGCVEGAPTLDAARSALQAADAAAQTSQGTLPAERTSLGAGKWRNGLRDRLKSD